MELFYSHNITDGMLFLEGAEENHCVRVLRHHPGDKIQVIDGQGTLFEGEITGIKKDSVVAKVLSVSKNFAARNYHLTVACCPTKNIDRYEYFIQKATEIGADAFVPLLGEHSERKVVNLERLRSVALSATKQSLKARIPTISPLTSVKEFLDNVPQEAIKLIAHCREGHRVFLTAALRENLAQRVVQYPQIVVLIGPEGDFSVSEISLALSSGFSPVHLGESRLRTETAAVVATTLVYSYFQEAGNE